MKKMLFFILLSSSFACSDDTEENTPQLSFQIEDGPRFASSQINITNTSSNYEGDYLWEVSSPFGSEQFTTENLSFEVTRIGPHTITLTTSDGSFETKSPLFVAQPSLKRLHKITLKEISKDYNGLYFKIKRYQASNNSFSDIYTSETKQNVNTSNVSEFQWNIETSAATFELTDIFSSTNFVSYEVEFFNENDESISRFDPFFTTISDQTEFKNEEISLLTTARDCSDCDQFEILVDISYDIE